MIVGGYSILLIDIIHASDEEIFFFFFLQFTCSIVKNWCS